MTMRASVIAGLVCAAVAGSASSSFGADVNLCRRGETYAPNWGCLPNSVVKQAKDNCLTGPAHTTKWTECLCQDGKQIGACGK